MHDQQNWKWARRTFYVLVVCLAFLPLLLTTYEDDKPTDIVEVAVANTTIPPTTVAPTTTTAAPTTTVAAKPVLCPGAPRPDLPCLREATSKKSSVKSTARAKPTTRAKSTPAVGSRGPASPALLACIRNHEQGAAGYGTNTGNGFQGAYQFTPQTWAGQGGRGNAANASPAEQDARASSLYSQRGLQPWPTPARACAHLT